MTIGIRQQYAKWSRAMRIELQCRANRRRAQAHDRQERMRQDGFPAKRIEQDAALDLAIARFFEALIIDRTAP